MAVVGTAALAGGAYKLFDYNRDNFKYDREMRQKCEFKVLDFRAKQAGLWREDIHDLIELTERRMDSYLIVNTLQLGMCVGLFTEGRLEAGTPQWLLRFYMLSLGAAFMYLLMSVWLAMHASVVAQTSGVRLLTQFVRLPIPTWAHIDRMRTYASSFENLGANMFRIPFYSSPAAQSSQWQSKSKGCSVSQLPGYDTETGEGKDLERGRNQSIPKAAASHHNNDNFDVWGLEEHGHNIEELQDVPPSQRRHVGMVRAEALHWQCHDAFARVAMSFGTNQLLSAISYYCMGYVSIQDGAAMPACCVAALMMSIAVTLVYLDFTMTPTELSCAIALIITGPVCVSITTFLRTTKSLWSHDAVTYCLPVGYVAHAAWLLWSLRALGMMIHPNGAWLPMRYRAVAYLDVFGWYTQIATKVRETQQKCWKDMFVIDVLKTLGDECDRPATLRALQALPQPQGKFNEHRKRGGHWATQTSVSHLPSFTKQETEDSASETSTTDTKSLAWVKQRLTDDCQLLESQEVQDMFDDEDRQKISSLSEKLYKAAAEIPKFQGEGLLESATDVTVERDSDLESNSSHSTLPSRDASDKAAWVRLKGHTDCGTEMPYFYNPQTQNCRTMSFDVTDHSIPSSPWARLTSDKRAALRLSDFEEHVEEFCKKVEYSKTSEAKKVKLPTHQEEDEEDDDNNSFSPIKRVSHAASQAISWVRNGPEEAEPLLANKGAIELECRDSNRLDGMHDDADPFHGPATDNGKVQPGEVPWTMLLRGTKVLIILWCVGLLLPEMGMSPLRAESSLQAQSDRGVNPLNEVIAVATAVTNPDMQSLEALGEKVQVQWPRSSGFAPRSLSCDPYGLQFVVSDDFGVYIGEMLENTWSKVAPQGRKLGGASTSFSRAPPCTAFEGQTLKDIGVVCAKGECRVLVLHANGRRLTECPLPEPRHSKMSAASNHTQVQAGLVTVSNEQESTTGPPTHKSHKSVKPVISWKISGQWLDVKNERVESVAVNNEFECRAHGPAIPNDHTFHPNGHGCLVVGTGAKKYGRVVQLRQHVQHNNELVPEWSMQKRTHSIAQGSLHVLPGGVVMSLRPEIGTVQALDVRSGNVLGEWKLREDISWITLCGTESYLYILGRLRGKREVDLWRFPLPKVLQDRKNSVARGRAGAVHEM